MTPQKKKPRQRNRPKNKANRQEVDANFDITKDIKPNEVKLNDSQISNKTQINAEISISHPETRLATDALYQTHSAMQFLQEKMRLKFLKNQQDIKLRTKPSSKSTNEVERLMINNKNNFNGNSRSCSSDNEPALPAKQTVQPPKKSKLKKENNVTAATIAENSNEKNAFIANLQKQMETVMAKGNTDLPQTLLGNLQKLLDQEPISDIESSDDEAEYIEYVYKPRQYFLATLCNVRLIAFPDRNLMIIKRMIINHLEYCKIDLLKEQSRSLPCKRCNLTYYCTKEHMNLDKDHRQLCYGLKQIAEDCGGHVFYRCGNFSVEQFRSYRIVTIRSVESLINRKLNAEEQEIILFPRICCKADCREYRFEKLQDCEKCGQIAFCRDDKAHFLNSHQRWCRFYQLFKELIIFQTKFGRLEPSLPTKILKDLPSACCNTRQILHKLCFDIIDPCEYAVLSQISTGPLTAWYALKLCAALKKTNGLLTIHLIGAEIEFEVDLLHKWELFFLHITPAIKKLNIVFIGPELNPRNISFQQLKKSKCCCSCRKAGRSIHYNFECKLYHVYCNMPSFLQPDLICFFNAGLYRATGYQLEDTWPDTILAAANLKCPITVTSYTEYEAPLDMTRFIQKSNRHLNVVLPPIVNPFASEKPERNFVSDDEAPLMFKNFYCFVIE